MLSNGNWSIGFRSIVLLASITVVLGIGMANAQDFTYHDDFNDGDVTNASGGGRWIMEPTPSGAAMDASSGDLVLNTGRGFMGVHLVSFDGVPLKNGSEWSFRARMTVHGGTFAAVGTTALNHAALIPGGPTGDGMLRVGTTSADTVRKPLPYPFYGEEVLIQMDAFGGLLTGSVWKDGDPTSLVQLSKSYTPKPTLPNFGLSGSSGNVTFYEAWVSTTPLPIFPGPLDPLLGDLNLDGDVDGLDVDPFVDVLVGGLYQVEADMNGDQVVNGLYVAPFVTSVVDGGTRPVPEPSTLLLACVALGMVAGWRRWYV